MKIQDLLNRIVKEGASDGFITAEAPPCIKVDGQIYPISDKPLTDAQTLANLLAAMPDAAAPSHLAGKISSLAADVAEDDPWQRLLDWLTEMKR